MGQGTIEQQITARATIRVSKGGNGDSTSGVGTDRYLQASSLYYKPQLYVINVDSFCDATRTHATGQTGFEGIEVWCSDRQNFESS